jgi:hypothetical protein
LFFQKKIKQLNVPFIEDIVLIQSAARDTLSSDVDVKKKQMKMNIGMENTVKQAVESKQLDIFFKENVLFTSDNFSLFLRLFLAIMNNL